MLGDRLRHRCQTSELIPRHQVSNPRHRPAGAHRNTQGDGRGDENPPAPRTGANVLCCPHRLQFPLQTSGLLPHSQINPLPPASAVPGPACLPFPPRNAFCVSPLPRFLSALQSLHQRTRSSSPMLGSPQQNICYRRSSSLLPTFAVLTGGAQCREMPAKVPGR